jgi:hypothetical protein
VRNTIVKDWLERQVYRSLRRELGTAWGRTVEVRFMVHDPEVETGRSGEFVAVGESADVAAR